MQPQLRQILNGALVQLVRMPACHAGGHGFESRTHRKNFKSIRLLGVLVQLVRMPACHAGGHGFESRTHRLRKKTEIRKSKTISSKSVTLGIFFCYTTTDEYPVGSRKLDKSSNQIVTKKKNGNFGYDFVDMSLICRCLRSILSTRRNLKS